MLLTGNAFQAFLTRADQDALIATGVTRHLAPDGVFGFETRNPAGHDLGDEPEGPSRRSTTSTSTGQPRAG